MNPEREKVALPRVIPGQKLVGMWLRPEGGPKCPLRLLVGLLLRQLRKKLGRICTDQANIEYFQVIVTVR
jgi:hypothetical protein